MHDKPLTTFKSAAEGNYSHGRHGGPVKYVIIHVMQGTLRGTTEWFCNPANHAVSSAHYGIGFDGDIIQYVKDEDTAWHAGNSDYNRQGLGIELEGFMERGFFPDSMMEALVDLTLHLCSAHGVPVDREHIIGHCEVPSPDGNGFGGKGHHADPGPKFPWDKFMSMLAAKTAAWPIS